MRNLAQLSLDGRIDLWMAMAVEVRPDRRIAIEVLPPLCISQHGSPALNDHDRLMLQPILHLREGMPNVLMIELG